jgi:hypothetical protein
MLKILLTNTEQWMSLLFELALSSNWFGQVNIEYRTPNKEQGTMSTMRRLEWLLPLAICF